MPIKNIIPGQRVKREKLERARELRREMTAAEKVLWQELRGNKLGVHFRRQQIIAGFIVDFYCHIAGLVIEVDGSIHQEGEQRELDKIRERALNELGLRILRFRNDEIMLHLPDVLGRICSHPFRGGPGWGPEHPNPVWKGCAVLLALVDNGWIKPYPPVLNLRIARLSTHALNGRDD